MEEILAGISGVVLTAAAALGVFLRRQGDARLILHTDRAAGFRVDKVEEGEGESRVEISWRMPLINYGRQNGMVLEVLGQVEYPGEIYSRLEVLPRFRLQGLRRDWYWEAVIIKKGARHVVEGSVVIRFQGSLAELKEQLGRLKMVVYYKVIGRGKMTWRTGDLRIPLTIVPVSQGEGGGRE